MATLDQVNKLATGGLTGQVYFAPAGTEPPTGNIRYDPQWKLASNENWHYTFTTTGGKKLANVNVADLFEVFPELKPTSEESSENVEQTFADNLRKAADYNRGKRAQHEVRAPFAENLTEKFDIKVKNDNNDLIPTIKEGK